MTTLYLDRRYVVAGGISLLGFGSVRDVNGVEPGLPAPQLTAYSAADADWLRANVPLFDCSDPNVTAIYNFRWLRFRDALRRTPIGWVVWEFPFPVQWAGLYNCIVDAAGHHIYEGRWLRNPRYIDDYVAYWLDEPRAPIRGYSSWLADAIHARMLASGDYKPVERHLQRLVESYLTCEAVHRGPDGLYYQLAVNDGMEEQLGGDGGQRPTLNAYQYGDARAIAAMARMVGQKGLAARFDMRAEQLKALVQAKLWNPAHGFFETRDPQTGRHVGVRELHGYTPWYFGMPDARFAGAWRELTSPEGFDAPFGPTTAERRAPGFRLVDDDSRWDGSSWPFATSQTLVALARLIRSRAPAPVGRVDYIRLLETYTRTQHRRDADGTIRPWIGESVHPLTGGWTSETAGYNHSAYADHIITGVVGLVPRDDATIEIDPLLPPSHWDHFLLRDVPYHGLRLTIIYDRDGRHYGLGRGLHLFADGRRIGHRESLGRLTVHMTPQPAVPPHAVTIVEDIGPQPDPGGKVLATASFFQGRHDPTTVLDGYPLDLFWSSYESGFASDWIQLTFAALTRLETLTIHFCEDEEKHRPPSIYTVEWWTGASWTAVTNVRADPPIPALGANRIAFAPVETMKIRVVVANPRPGRRGVGVAISEIGWD